MSASVAKRRDRGLIRELFDETYRLARSNIAPREHRCHRYRLPQLNGHCLACCIGKAGMNTGSTSIAFVHLARTKLQQPLLTGVSELEFINVKGSDVYLQLVQRGLTQIQNKIRYSGQCPICTNPILLYKQAVSRTLDRMWAYPIPKRLKNILNQAAQGTIPSERCERCLYSWPVSPILFHKDRKLVFKLMRRVTNPVLRENLLLLLDETSKFMNDPKQTIDFLNANQLTTYEKQMLQEALVRIAVPETNWTAAATFDGNTTTTTITFT